MPGWGKFAAIIVCCALVTAAACTHSRVPLASGNAPVLLFNGSGTSPNDVAAIEALLERNHLSYSRIDSSQLNTMPESELQEHRLLIMPGGNFIEIGNGLTKDGTAKIRKAVENGMGYLGICAGAFLASNYPGYNTLNLTSGAKFEFYSAEKKGLRKAAVVISLPAGPTLEHYWEDGPQLTGWGSIIGKYPDGTPAIVQGTFGKGWVVLTGFHPEAPESWRNGMAFRTPASEDNDYAAKLIGAALRREPLPNY